MNYPSHPHRRPAMPPVARVANAFTFRGQLAAEAEETVRATYAEGYADGIMRRRTDGRG